METDDIILDNISNFIRQNLTVTISYIDCLKELQKLAYFLENYDYCLEPDLIIEIIQQNSELDDILGIVVDHYLPLIKNGEFASTVKNEFIVCLIENYCLIHEIKINPKYEINDNSANSMQLDEPSRIYLQKMYTHPSLSEKELKQLLDDFTHGDIDLILSDYNPEEIAENHVLRDELFSLMKQELTNRDITIFLLLNGFINGRECTQPQVGQIYNISKQRVCAINRKVLRKIRTLAKYKLKD